LIFNGLEPSCFHNDFALALYGTKYHFNQEAFPDRNFASGQQYGFIAQELEQVIPEATVLNSDGYYAVNYTMLIPVLTEAIKEQDKTVTELRNELAELRSQINDLKAGQQKRALLLRSGRSRLEASGRRRWH